MSLSTAPQLLDVTLRDGGYVNGWNFPLQDARAIVSTLSKGGVPYIEVGYYRTRPPSNGGGPVGPSSCCAHEYLEAVASVRGNSKLTVMVHLNDVRLTDYTFLADHDISCVRFVVSSSNLDEFEAHIDAVHEAGLFSSVNLIRASERSIDNMVMCALAAEKAGADWLYIADSNGSLFPDRVEQIFHNLSSELRIPVGFHAHDSLHLAFANSLSSLSGGGTLLDSSLGGMGKGAGNLITELITAYLKAAYHEQYNVSELTAVACQTLSAWIRCDHARRCESTLSALLDLNADRLKDMVSAANKADRSLLLELEFGLDHSMTTIPVA